MAQSVDIKIYPNATATCSNCSSVYMILGNKPEIQVEICGNCHPFYTGQDVVVDTAGRIEKFQARLAKSQSIQKTGKKTKVKKKRTQSQTLEELSGDFQSEDKPKVTEEPKQTE